MESFYVTLPLNEKQTHEAFYNTEFDQNINLTGSWEVGLSEISFTKSWPNILTTQNIALYYFDPSKENGVGKHITNDAIITTGYYTKETLITQLNKAVLKHFDTNLLKENRNIEVSKPPFIMFNNTLNNFKLVPGITNKSGFLYIVPTPQICEIIGYNYQEIIVNIEELFKKYYSFRKENPNENIPLPTDEAYMESKSPLTLDKTKYFYVISDICTERLFGSTRKNLLRFVKLPKRSKYGDQITVQYNSPQYISLKKNNFNSIEIKFTTELNHRKHNETKENYIKFYGGFALVTLHFRKISEQKLIDVIAPLRPKPNLKNPIPAFHQIIVNDQKALDLSGKDLIKKDTNDQKIQITCDPLNSNNCKNKKPILYTNLDDDTDTDTDTDSDTETKDSI
jgi:hypothetical protein